MSARVSRTGRMLQPSSLCALSELTQAVGITLWALGHGLAALTLDGQLALKAVAWGADPDDLLARAVRQIGRSLGVGSDR